MEWVFGSIKLEWPKDGIVTSLTGGRRKYKYGLKRRTTAAAGRVVSVMLTTGKIYRFRCTGDVIDFVDKVVAVKGDQIEQIFTQRGTLYSRVAKL